MNHTPSEFGRRQEPWPTLVPDVFKRDAFMGHLQRGHPPLTVEKSADTRELRVTKIGSKVAKSPIPASCAGIRDQKPKQFKSYKKAGSR
jgi:hypothetical protein